MISKILKLIPAKKAFAHCDGPCGVYDPASARIAAEAVLSMTKKIQGLQMPETDDKAAMDEYHNTLSRYIAIKEEQAELTKHEVLILWTDFFKPEHLEKHPDLHDLIWKTTKLCSEAKQHINLEAAESIMKNIEQIHDIFWGIKGKAVAFYTAS